MQSHGREGGAPSGPYLLVKMSWWPDILLAKANLLTFQMVFNSVFY